MRLNSKEKKNLEMRREDIIMSVPTFINQLLLLLSSGMVLQEALKMIAVKYGEEDKRKNYFAYSVYEIYRRTEENGEDFLKVFCNFGKESQVKELSRLARILQDSRERGTQLWDKLAKEGENLWAERRRRVTEKIRLVDSKMSFPLGLMMLALIIITAAPAMLQMYIN